jgi:hypothetical protein
MKINKIEVHLSNFMYIAGSVNRDKKLRFNLTIIMYCEEGEPLGITLEGCIAYINANDKLTWHPPAAKSGGHAYQNVKFFKRLHAIVVTQLSETKYAKQLKRNLLAYFEQTPGEINPELLNEPNEIVKEL